MDVCHFCVPSIAIYMLLHVCSMLRYFCYVAAGFGSSSIFSSQGSSQTAAGASWADSFFKDPKGSESMVLALTLPHVKFPTFTLLRTLNIQ